jgi:hypothetical protein
MDNNLFDDLVASIKEAGAIKRKEIKASRVTELELPDIKEVREKTGLSQGMNLLHVYISAENPAKLGTRPTLSNWTSSNIEPYRVCRRLFYLS